MSQFDVIVVGGGAAGLVAAGHSAELGANVLLLEKMGRPGRKLGITGKGRCNITNTASIQEFITCVKPNGRFLQSAFSGFFSGELINFINNIGIKIIKGLYFAGEVMDLDGPTGGYNLQIAFSTGWLAGESSAANK